MAAIPDPTSQFKSEEDFLQDVRVRSLFSPFYFTSAVLGYDKLVPDLHQHDNELFIKRLIEGKRYQFIEWPRRFFKTTTFTLGTGMWLVCPVTQQDTDYALGTLHLPEDEWFARVRLHDQNLLQLIAMETADNAMNKVAWIKNQFESNQLFRACFPEIAYQGDEEPWNRSGIKIRRTGNRRYENEGTFDAIGVGVSLQSRHYDVVWEDDLVGEKATKSEIEMQRTIEWHSRLDGAFVDPATQMRFGVSNRWGYNDLNSWIQTNEPQVIFYTRRAWEIDTSRQPDPELIAAGTKAGLNLTGMEVPIFPERFPMATLLEMRSRMRPYDFSCQYQNSPQLPGERELDFSKLHRYSRPDAMTFKCSCGKTFDAAQLQVYLHLDPSQARAASKSRNCIVAVGTTPDKHVVIIDAWMRKSDYGSIFKWLVKFNDAYRPKLLTYEDVGAQNMFEYNLRELQQRADFQNGAYADPERKVRGGHRRFPYIKPMPTKGKSKQDRIKEHFLSKVETYKVAYNPSLEWGKSLITQLERFPNPCPDHDYDLLDALAQGALVWQFPLNEDEAMSRHSEEEEYLRMLGKPYSGFASA